MESKIKIKFPCTTEEVTGLSFLLECRTGDSRRPSKDAVGALFSRKEGDAWLPFGGVIYDGFDYVGTEPFSAQIAVVGMNSGWMTAGVLYWTFHLPFNVLGLSRLTAAPSQENDQSIKHIHGTGFSLEGLIRKGYDGQRDVFLFGMLKEECLWIGNGIKDQKNLRLSERAIREGKNFVVETDPALRTLLEG